MIITSSPRHSVSVYSDLIGAVLAELPTLRSSGWP